MDTVVLPVHQQEQGMLGTANGAGCDFLTGKAVLGDEDGAAFDKRDCGIEAKEREAHGLADPEGGEGGGDDEGKAGREHGVGPGAGARATGAAPATAQARCSVGTRGRPQEIGPGTIC